MCKKMTYEKAEEYALAAVPGTTEHNGLINCEECFCRYHYKTMVAVVEPDGDVRFYCEDTCKPAPDMEDIYVDMANFKL